MTSIEVSANAIRFLSADAVENANSGHPGLPLGMADVATVLFQEFLSFYPKDPSWPNRDRFVLSGGHGIIRCCQFIFSGFIRIIDSF
jgi:transketolase